MGLVLLSILSGCSDYTLYGEHDPLDPAPVLTVSPARLDFGAIALGDETTRTLTLGNAGTSPLAIHELTLEAPVGFDLPAAWQATWLAPDATLDVDVRYRAAGRHETGQLLVVSDDPEQPREPVDLVGTGLQPELRVTLDDPHPQTVGCTETIEVLLESVGGAAVVIDGVALTGMGLSHSTLPALPFTLPPGEWLAFDVAAELLTAGENSGELQLATNEPVGTHRVALAFEGRDGPRLVVGTKTLQFDDVVVGCQIEGRIPVRNAGTCPLALDPITVSGEGVSLLDPEALPDTLASGEELDLGLVYAPDQHDALEGTAVIRSSESGEESTVTLSGRGDAPFLTVSLATGARLKDSYALCESSSAMLAVENPTDCPVTVTDLALDHEDFSVSGHSVPWTIPALSTQSLKATFAPMSTGVMESTLAVTMAGRDAPATLLLTAEGLESVALVTDDLSFSETIVGCDASAVLQVENLSSCTLTIDDISWAHAAYDVPAVADLPFTIGATSQELMSVTFSPTEVMSYPDTLSVATDLSHDIFTAAVEGAGVAHEAEESWVIEAEGFEVDLVFAVDSSCSMAPDVSTLRSQAGPFLTALDDQGADWQVTVVENDQGCTVVTVTDATESSIGTFQSHLQSTSGRYEEALLTTLSLAASESGAGGCTEGALREDSVKHLIVVSDEPEQSSRNWADLVADIQAAEPSAVISGIVETRASSGYDEAVLLTGGSTLSITESDWTDWFSALAERVSDPSTHRLADEPVEDTVVVTVEGQTWSDWTLDMSTLDLTVSGVEADEDGAEVVVSYELACD